MTQYRIQMFEEAVEEGVGQDRPPMNLTDRRSQHRSRWNHFDRATQETFIIPPAKFRIYQKGYFAYIFRDGSKTTLCARIIRLPSTCNGVTRGEWVFSLEVLPPNVIVQGMTLQPELDLLVVMVSSDQRMCVLTFALVVIALTLLGFRLLDTHMLRLSDGQPHPALPTPETVRAGPGFGIVAAYPCVTRSRLAVLIVNLRPDDWGADMLRGYDLCTGRVILVQFIQSRLSLMLQPDWWARTSLGISPISISSTISGCWFRVSAQLALLLCGIPRTQPPQMRGSYKTPLPHIPALSIGNALK